MAAVGIHIDLKGNEYDPKALQIVAWTAISQLGLSSKITKLQLGGPRVLEIIFPVEDLSLVRGKFNWLPVVGRGEAGDRSLLPQRKRQRG